MWLHEGDPQDGNPQHPEGSAGVQAMQVLQVCYIKVLANAAYQKAAANKPLLRLLTEAPVFNNLHMHSTTQAG